MATNASLYNTAYFTTHQQLLDQSIKLAEKEFVTLADRILLLEGKVADYERALATGYMSSSGKGGKYSASESEVTGRMRLQESRNQNEAKELTAVAKSAEKSFDISRFNMPDVRNTMQSQMRSGATVQSAVDGAISNIGGKGAGKDQVQRYVLAKSILQNAKSAATAQGKTYNEGILRNNIAAGMGLDANTMMLADEKIVQIVSKPKQDAIKAKYNAMPAIPGVRRIKEGDKGEIEDDLKESERKLQALEDQMQRQYGDDVDLGLIIERGREIYSQQYAPLTRAQRKELRKMKTAENLSPTARKNYEAYTSVRDDVSYYNIKDKKLTYDIYNAENAEDIITSTAIRILDAKKAGRDTDVRSLASQLTDTPEQARAALGLAMHYFVENQSDMALDQSMKDMIDKVENTSDEKASINEAAMEQGLTADSIQRDAAKVIAEVEPDLDSFAETRERMADDKITERMDASRTEQKDSFFDKLFSGRLFERKEEAEPVLEPVPLTEQDIPDEFKPSEPQGVDPALLESQGVLPPTQFVPIEALDIGTEIKKDPSFSYGYRLERVAPNGQRQYSGTGAIEGKTLNPAMQAEADLAYEAELLRRQQAAQEGQ